MIRPRLYGTPLSHFTRKVRALLAELEIEHEMVWAPSVLAAQPATFGDNPLMRVPCLHLDGAVVIESDHIARVLVQSYDPDDRLGVRSERIEDLNRLGVANGVMDNEVVLLLAKRSGLTDWEGVDYFRKLLSGIEGGLAWLDAHTDEGGPLRYADLAIACAWDHVRRFDLVREPARFVRLTARLGRFADRPSLRETAPARSLAIAAATGWVAG